MIRWSVTFLLIAILAGILGMSGVASAAVDFAWIMFVGGIVLSIAFFLVGKTGPGQSS